MQPTVVGKAQLSELCHAALQGADAEQWHSALWLSVLTRDKLHCSMLGGHVADQGTALPCQR